MINVIRSLPGPSSLNTPEIRTYIDNVIQHKNDPINIPKPVKPVPYRSSDLLEAFDRDFFSKCYLTELRFTTAWSMDIEHFVSQTESPELVYEWTNLFPADHYSNMIKPRRTYDGGLLDPSNPNHDVESEIIYTLSNMGEDPKFDPRDAQNIKAVNTCQLLYRIHNGHDEPTKNGTKELRHGIRKRYNDVLLMIIEWRRHPDGTQEKAQAERELKGLLSRKSSFTMLLRSIPVVRQLPLDFFD